MFVNFLIIKKQIKSDRRKLLFRHPYKLSERVPLQTLQISEWALLSWFEEALIKFFSCKEGRSLQEGVHLGRGAVSDNYGNRAFVN